MNRQGWTTRFGFYLAAIGSACGLGNLWRFPYIVGDNGGGAFVLLYVLLCFVIGLPILIGELMLGKIQRKSVVQALKSLSANPSGGSSSAGNRIGSNLQWIGYLGLTLSLVVLSYYAVISGWVLHFLMQFLMEFAGFSSDPGSISLSQLLNSGPLQVGLASVHLLVTMIIVMKGFTEGLERTVAVVMPIFAVLLFILFAQALSLPGVPQALRFLFYPDFSQLKSGALLHALGHVCFTLSVGFGVMVTFGSHLSNEVHVPGAAFRVMVVDTCLSLLSGLLVFSVALSASEVPISDPGLLFEALPRFIIGLKGGALFGIAFFLCLYLAALAASIGLLEGIVANMIEARVGSRKSSAWLVGIIALIISIFPAISSNWLQDMKLFGKGILEFLDSFLINWYLPPVAIALAYVLVRRVNAMDIRQHFLQDDQPDTQTLYPYWQMILRYVAPAVMVIAVLLQVYGAIKGR